MIDKLLKIQIVDVVKLTPSQAHYTKLVKVYCDNDKKKMRKYKYKNKISLRQRFIDHNLLKQRTILCSNLFAIFVISVLDRVSSCDWIGREIITKLNLIKLNNKNRTMLTKFYLNNIESDKR